MESLTSGNRRDGAQIAGLKIGLICAVSELKVELMVALQTPKREEYINNP